MIFMGNGVVVVEMTLLGWVGYINKSPSLAMCSLHDTVSDDW